MKISIIIPIYNAEKTIERLIKTIQLQTYKNYELILINDGSIDKTKEILEKYKNDNVKIISKNNEGVGKARKIGFEYATGDIIFFCDSDDYLPNEYVFEKINNKFLENNIDILMFDAIDISNNGKKIVNCFSKEIKPGLHKVEEINDYFLFGPLFLKIFRKDKLNNNCFIEFNNFEDTYTTYKSLNNCDNFYYEKDIYYVFDEIANENSLTKIKNINKFIKTIDLIELIYNESKLKKSCCISAFNYYLYLISLIETHVEWPKDKVQELKLKMNNLEKIFLLDFELIQRVCSEKNIKKYLDFKSKYINKKILLIDGMSTTGKSTISDKIYNILVKNNINVKWIHEESYNEINLNLELSKHDNNEIEKIKKEMANSFQRWKKFYKKINEDNYIYILDSNFFKNIHDYLLFSGLNIEEIIQYYNKIINIFDKEKIQFVLLKREAIKESFEKTFQNRGFFWETHLKKQISEKYQKQSLIPNENIIYQYEEIYQKTIEKIFDQFEIDKVKITTDKEEWNEYVKLILNNPLFNICSEAETEYNHQKYLGHYRCENWNIEIYFDESKNKLFLSAFWPNIELKYIGNDTFKLDKFPLNLHYINNNIIFYGDLIWEMKNKNFIKSNHPKILKKNNK